MMSTTTTTISTVAITSLSNEGTSEHNIYIYMHMQYLFVFSGRKGNEQEKSTSYIDSRNQATTSSSTTRPVQQIHIHHSVNRQVMAANYLAAHPATNSIDGHGLRPGGSDTNANVSLALQKALRI
jgi:hypothetical protein